MSSYEIQEGDVIETRNFYTISQLAEFMDVKINANYTILVNNRPADFNTLVYENFTIDWVVDTDDEEDASFGASLDGDASLPAVAGETALSVTGRQAEEGEGQEEVSPQRNGATAEWKDGPSLTVNVTVNGEPVSLTGKIEYIFVDLFDFYDFDLNDANGRAIVTKVNGKRAGYMQHLFSGDVVEIYWEEF